MVTAMDKSIGMLLDAGKECSPAIKIEQGKEEWKK